MLLLHKLGGSQARRERTNRDRRLIQESETPRHEAIDRWLDTPFTLFHSKASGEIRQALVDINEPTDSNILVLGAKERITSPQVFLTN